MVGSEILPFLIFISIKISNNELNKALRNSVLYFKTKIMKFIEQLSGNIFW